MKSDHILIVGFSMMIIYLTYLFIIYSPIQTQDPLFYSIIPIYGTAIFSKMITSNMNESNPVLGTLVVEEHDGKKYKMMFVEEIPDELTDWEIVSKVSHLLRVPNDNKISDNSTDALFLINYAIREENAKDQTFGPYRYWWTFSSAGLIFDTPVKMINGDKSEVYPYQFAKSKSVIHKVVDKLGVDIFRIAAGVKRD